MQSEEDILQQPDFVKTQKEHRYKNVDRKVSGMVIVLASLFVLFMCLVALDLIGAISVGHILHYVPKLHRDASKVSLKQDNMLLDLGEPQHAQQDSLEADAKQLIDDYMAETKEDNELSLRRTYEEGLDAAQPLDDTTLVGQKSDPALQNIDVPEAIETIVHEAQAELPPSSYEVFELSDVIKNMQERLKAVDQLAEQESTLHQEFESELNTSPLATVDEQSGHVEFDYQPTYSNEAKPNTNRNYEIDAERNYEIDYIVSTQEDGPSYTPTENEMYTVDFVSMPDQHYSSFVSKRQVVALQMQAHHKAATRAVGQKEKKKEQIRFRKETMEKPIVDHNHYYHFELPNKLKVLLIYDESATIAQTALNVEVGSWHEPNEFPGLAHFLEHMLFLGSEQYPVMGHFDDMISNAGGMSNAYTTDENTNYYFSVASSRLNEALQIFAHMFIDPLFDPKAIELEVNAVNSEYETSFSYPSMNLQNLLILLSDPAHPASRFSMGNNDSLQKEGIASALQQFFAKHYSANIMTLAIKSNLDPNKLEEWVKRESDFSRIPNNDYTPERFASLGAPLKKLPAAVKMNILQQEKQLILLYQLEAVPNWHDTKPLDFLTYFLTSSHEGGLEDYLLRQQGFVARIEADTMSDYAAYHHYVIQLQLPSDSKVEFDQRQLAFRIAKVVENYFEKLKEDFFEGEAATQYLQDVYAEQAKLAEINFRYMENSESSEHNDIFFITESMSRNPIDKVLSAEFLLETFDPVIIKAYVDQFTDPSKMLIVMADSEYTYAKAFESGYKDVTQLAEVQKGSDPEDLKFLADNKVAQYASLHRLAYEVRAMADSTVDFIFKREQNIIKNFEMPSLNDYVPDTLDLVTLCHQKQSNYVLNLPEMHDDQPTDSYTDNEGPQTITSMGSSETEQIELPEYELPETQQVEDLRDQMFLTTETTVPLVFASPEECASHELAYEQHNRYPQLLQRDLAGKVWWQIDRTFEMPSAFIAIKFDTALDLNSIGKQTMLQVYNMFLADKLREDLDQALHTGYEVEFNTGNRGMTVKMYGFSAKIKAFFKHILNCMNPNRKKGFLQVSNDIEQKRFDRVKAQLGSALKQSFDRSLYEQLEYIYLPLIMSQPFYKPQDQVKQLSQLSYGELESFRQDMFKNFRFTSLFVGNVLKDESFEFINEMKDILSESTSEVLTKPSRSKVINLHGLNVIYALPSQAADENDLNGATLNFYQLTKRTQKSLTMMKLLQGVFANKAFKYLRTELQLGYSVQASFRPMGCVDGLQIFVQGDSRPPYEVNEHIEAFLQKFGRELENLSEAELDSMKRGVIARLDKRIDSLKDQGQFLWHHIEYGDLAFEEKAVAASMIKQISKEDVVDFYHTAFRDPNRGKLSIQLYGKGMQNKLFANEDFTKSLESKGLTSQQSYAKADEKIVFNSQQFSTMVSSAFNCDYQITNI